MRIGIAVLVMLVLLVACSDSVVRVQRSDGEEAVALAIIDALKLNDFDALDAVMVSPEDIVAQRQKLSKAENEDAAVRAIVDAAWQVDEDDLPRNIATAREVFARIIRQGIERDIDWENIEYTGYSGNLKVLKGKPMQMDDFLVYFTSNEVEWKFFVPHLQRLGTQWKIRSFNFELLDKMGMPPPSEDSWNSQTQDEDSWESSDDTTSNE